MLLQPYRIHRVNVGSASSWFQPRPLPHAPLSVNLPPRSPSEANTTSSIWVSRGRYTQGCSDGPARSRGCLPPLYQAFVRSSSTALVVAAVSVSQFDSFLSTALHTSGNCFDCMGSASSVPRPPVSPTAPKALQTFWPALASRKQQDLEVLACKGGKPGALQCQ